MASALANAVVNSITRQARMLGPQDPLTLVAFALNGVLRFLLLLPVLILTPVSTLILGLVFRLPLVGLIPLLALSIIWLPLMGLLLATSWLWVKIPILRPILLVPGVLLANVTFAYVSLVPDMGEKYQKVLKLGLCDSWPFSYLTFQLSKSVDTTGLV